MHYCQAFFKAFFDHFWSITMKKTICLVPQVELSSNYVGLICIETAIKMICFLVTFSQTLVFTPNYTFIF